MDKILIITARAGFPNGFGASSILRKYSQGFSEINYKCEILLLRPSEYEDGEQLNIFRKGFFNDVYYEYMCNSTTTSTILIKRLIMYITGVLRTCKYLIKNRNDISKVFFYSPDYLLSTLFIQCICMLTNLSCTAIKTESSYSDLARKRKPLWRLAEKMIYRLFDSMIVISQYLKNQVRKNAYKKKIYVLPIIVNEDMYKGTSGEHKKNDLIYMGTLNYEEELMLLIESFFIVNQKKCDWNLKIIGSFINKEIETRILNHISTLKLENSIEFAGQISSRELPQTLINGKIMLLPRIDKEYSKAGFPIKLGEYLLSGVPVILTKVGEVSNYLKDNEEVFYSELIDAKSFSDKIIWVIENYEEAIKVGIRGQKKAIELFGSKRICEKMIEC